MKTALHTISYSGSWGQASLSLDDIIQRAASLGFDGIMLAAKRPHASILDMSPTTRQHIRDTLTRHRLELACLAAYTNFSADAEHAEVPHREMQIHYVQELARLVVDLGGNIVRIFTSYDHEAIAYARNWQQTVAAVKECARRAADVGAVIAVQNHHDLAGHSEGLTHFLQAVDEPNCRAAFDAWSPALQGDDIINAAAKLATLTVHTTVADYIRVPRFRYQPDLVNYRQLDDYVQAVPMGEGFIDYRGFLSKLAAHGYGGFVAYEMCSPLRDGNSLEILDRYARRFMEFMRT
jgi:sugar phosphate isomerase/epimerase